MFAACLQPRVRNRAVNMSVHRHQYNVPHITAAATANVTLLGFVALLRSTVDVVVFLHGDCLMAFWILDFEKEGSTACFFQLGDVLWVVLRKRQVNRTSFRFDRRKRTGFHRGRIFEVADPRSQNSRVISVAHRRSRSATNH